MALQTPVHGPDVVRVRVRGFSVFSLHTEVTPVPNHPKPSKTIQNHPNHPEDPDLHQALLPVLGDLDGLGDHDVDEDLDDVGHVDDDDERFRDTYERFRETSIQSLRKNLQSSQYTLSTYAIKFPKVKVHCSQKQRLQRL